jgi:dethiobiotin synthetase
LGLPIHWIVAASPDLGTLHHTRATVEFMQARRAKVAGFVFCHPQSHRSDLADDNRETLASLLDLPCLGELPFAESWMTPAGLNPKDAQRWIQSLMPGMDKWMNKRRASIR